MAQRLLHWSESLFSSVPLPLMDAWGRFGYTLGIVLMILAYAGCTFKPGGRWGLGLERQSWDFKALISMPLTFVLVLASGYVGSSIVLVPGAQTFESLKDLAVFACLVLFGYPALVIVPFAYGVSDIIEGVPPDFLLDWLLGYFINPACFWIAYQFIGRNPDFRRLRTWGWYVSFVLIFLLIEPELWGYICSGKFTAEISYRNITPALFFTTVVTWILSPFAMLFLLPLARRFGIFWADIPGHVRQMEFRYKDVGWARVESVSDKDTAWNVVPIRMFIAGPLILFVLIMVGTTAYVTLQASETAANKLAIRLQKEIDGNLRLQMDDFLDEYPRLDGSERYLKLQRLLKGAIIEHGRVFVVDRVGHFISAASKDDTGGPLQAAQDVVVTSAIKQLSARSGGLAALDQPVEGRFDVITERPLSRAGWLLRAGAYRNASKGVDWIVVSCMPTSYYLAGIQAGHSQAAIVVSVALVASLLVAAVLAGLVTAPIRRLASATQAISAGNLTERALPSRLEEIAALSSSLNNMAARLSDSFDKVTASDRLFKELGANIEDVLWVMTPHSGGTIYVSAA
ncbi:MAG: HAMP domain-containing protein [Spirochaetia bacterium]|nr:HAMP domain-containing protein [Spirochaetia bacterium]